MKNDKSYWGSVQKFFCGSAFAPKLEPEKETRTAFKTQVMTEKDLQLTAEEIQLADRFDKLGRSCRRMIERHHPRNWEMLDIHVKEHEDPDHNFNHR